MAIAQTLQSAKGGILAGLAEPVDVLMGSGQFNANQQHMLSSQRMATGWANLQTAASEYTQKGFYQQLAFGTQPQFAEAGLRNEMALQKMAAGMPFQAGVPSNAAELRHFSDSVMEPFKGLIGFQEPYSQTLAAAAGAGLARAVGGPGQLAEAATQLGALTAGFNKVYGVSGAESGAMYTQMLASGVPLNQAQGTYEAAVRADAAGTPLGQSMGAVSQYERSVRSRERMGVGGAGPGGGVGFTAADVVGQEVEGQMLRRQLQNAGYSMTGEDSARYNATRQQLDMMNHSGDTALESNRKTAALLTFGTLAKQIDFDQVSGSERALEMRRTMEEERSATYSGMRDVLGQMTSVPGAFGTAVRIVSDRFAPQSVRDMVAGVTGYTQEAPQRDKNGNVQMTPRALDIAAGSAATLSKMGAYGAAQDAIGAARNAEMPGGDMVAGISGLMKIVEGENFPKGARDEAMKKIEALGGKNWFQQFAAAGSDPAAIGALAGHPNQPGLAAIETTLKSTVADYSRGLEGDVRAGKGLEAAAMHAAGTDRFGNDNLNRLASKLELNVATGVMKPEEASRAFNAAAKSDAPKSLFAAQLGEVTAGGAGARMAGLNEMGDIQAARTAERNPDIIRAAFAQAEGALKSNEHGGTKNESIISQLSKGAEHASFSGFREVMRGAAPEQQRIMQKSLSEAVNAGQVSPGTPDFGNFQGALVTAGRALIDVSKLVSNMTPAKKQS